MDFIIFFCPRSGYHSESPAKGLYLSQDLVYHTRSFGTHGLTVWSRVCRVCVSTCECARVYVWCSCECWTRVRMCVSTWAGVCMCLQPHLHTGQHYRSQLLVLQPSPFSATGSWPSLLFMQARSEGCGISSSSARHLERGSSNRLWPLGPMSLLGKWEVSNGPSPRAPGVRATLDWIGSGNPR